MHSRRLAVLATATAALAAGCKSKLEAVPPAIQLLDSAGAALSTLTFPATAFGASSSELFTIKSISTTPLAVSALALSGSAASFYTVAPVDGGAPPPLSLGEDQTASFAVTFAPIATPPVPQGLIPEKATLTVTSNDPSNGSVAVPLAGQAAAPAISVCWLRAAGSQTCLSQGPLSIQFGDVPLGRGNSSQPAVIEISSATDGGAPLTITSVTLDATGLDGGFALVSPVPTTPAVLSGSTSLTYYVALFPEALGTASGNLIIESDDPHFPPGSPPQVGLLANVTPRSPPFACEGVLEDAPAAGATGIALTADGGLGTSWVPAPLDTITLTGIVDAGCSGDAVDPQSGLLFGFSLVDGGEPPGSAATLQAVSGEPAETTVQLDLVGSYQVDAVVTDLVGLPSAPASVTFTARPRDDIAAQLTWGASASRGAAVPMQLDLHLVRQLTPDGGVDAGTLLTSANDCWWVNCLDSQPRLAWGSGGGGSFGDPLVGTEFGQPTAPFPASAEAYTTLSGPQAGAEYDLYVWYFHVESGESVGNCTTDADCTQAGYPHCNTLASSPACVPSGLATLRVFVSGQDVTDGGLPFTLGAPCDLWHAGTLQWIGGGQLPDGGTLPPQYAFTPIANVTSDTAIGCAP
jgi:hypothetical protein